MTMKASPSKSISAANLLTHNDDMNYASMKVTWEHGSMQGSSGTSRQSLSTYRAASVPIASTSTSRINMTTPKCEVSVPLAPRATSLTATSPFNSESEAKLAIQNTSTIKSPTKPDVKGKGKAKDEGIEPSVSLMRRLAGPSDQKAGLLRNPEEVKEIIYEASKGSAYFKQQEKKDADLTTKVDELLRHLEKEVKSRRGNLKAEEALVDEMIAEMEKTLVLTETIVVVDADAFYASCHERQDSSLKGKAFGVGGGSGGGVLTTASYEARRYGCSSAMAGFVAKKLCPHLLFVKPDFSLYTAASKEIFTILRQYGEISPASLDEAYCSLTEYCRRENCSPAVAAERMRAEILEKTGLSVSAGVSPNAMLSKVAADRNKPNGQCVINSTREDCIKFASSLRIRQIPGIGRVSERFLQAVGINSVADVYRERGRLFLIRNKIGLSFLLRAYLGLGQTTITHADRNNRGGISVERTFSSHSEVKEFYARIRNIADALAEDCKNSEYSGRTLTLKLKFDNYDLISRAVTLGQAIFFNDAGIFFREGKKLLDREIAQWKKTRDQGLKTKGGKIFALRLIGLRLSNLRDDRALKQAGSSGLTSWANVTKPTKKRKPSKATSKKRKKVSSISAANASTVKEEDRLINDDFEAVVGAVKVETAEKDMLESESSGFEGSSSGSDVSGEEDEEDASSQLTSFAVPHHSSEPWPGDEDTDMGNEAFLAEVDALAAEYGPVDTTYKPFFTAGESLNGKKEKRREGPAPEKDRLRFAAETEILVISDSDDDDGDEEGSSTTTKTGIIASSRLICPICSKSFVGSEVAMTGHVLNCMNPKSGGRRTPKDKTSIKKKTGVFLNRAK